MHVAVVGDFPEIAQKNIRSSFPKSWQVDIVRLSDSDSVLQDADVLIPEHIPVDESLLDRAPHLRLVQTGAGYDNVDVAACSKRHILVCNAAGVNANAVAEHTMALMLGWFKNIAYLDDFMKSHRDEQELCYCGGELRGKTVGILGLGAIGQRVAALCQAFGMKVLVYRRHPKTMQGIKQVSLDDLYARSDILTVHVPLTPETRHMVSREAFAKMKKSAVLINTSRGAVLDEKVLTEALQQHEIAGACLDVFEKEPLPQSSPLRRLPNVLLTPHTAGLPDGVKYHRARYAFFVSNIEKVWAAQRPACLINEEIWLVSR